MYADQLHIWAQGCHDTNALSVEKSLLVVAVAMSLLPQGGIESHLSRLSNLMFNALYNAFFKNDFLDQILTNPSCWDFFFVRVVLLIF